MCAQRAAAMLPADVHDGSTSAGYVTPVSAQRRFTVQVASVPRVFGGVIARPQGAAGEVSWWQSGRATLPSAESPSPK